jgi:hypothetical protein
MYGFMQFGARPTLTTPLTQSRLRCLGKFKIPPLLKKPALAGWVSFLNRRCRSDTPSGKQGIPLGFPIA